MGGFRPSVEIEEGVGIEREQTVLRECGLLIEAPKGHETLEERDVVAHFLGAGVAGGGEKERAADLRVQVIVSLTPQSQSEARGLFVGKLAVQEAQCLGG